MDKKGNLGNWNDKPTKNCFDEFKDDEFTQKTKARKKWLEEYKLKGKSSALKEMVEMITEIADVINDMEENPDVMDSQIEDDAEPIDTENGTPGGNEDDLLNSLNQIFTPILVMQGFEGDVTKQIQEAFSESCVLLERNIIQFDNTTKMAQLTSICALLIARQKNSTKYQMYKKAAEVRKTMKLDIQKDEYAAAQALAQKFLVKVSTTNNSSVARQSANELLPETQH